MDALPDLAQEEREAARGAIGSPGFDPIYAEQGAADVERFQRTGASALCSRTDDPARMASCVDRRIDPWEIVGVWDSTRHFADSQGRTVGNRSNITGNTYFFGVMASNRKLIIEVVNECSR